MCRGCSTVDVHVVSCLWQQYGNLQHLTQSEIPTQGNLKDLTRSELFTKTLEVGAPHGEADQGPL